MTTPTKPGFIYDLDQVTDERPYAHTNTKPIKKQKAVVINTKEDGINYH
jgi:hypothetical protein